MSHQQQQDDDDDDDIANLFSFGADEQPSSAAFPQADNETHYFNSTTTSSTPRSTESSWVLENDNDDMALAILGPTNNNKDLDSETQEMLQYLDQRREGPPSVEQSTGETTSNNNSKATKASATPTPTLVQLPPVVTSLKEALQSSEATVSQIRALGKQSTKEPIDPAWRTEFYCRLLTGKTLDDVHHSSLAHSFETWSRQYQQQPNTAPWIKSYATQLAARINNNTITAQDLETLIAYQQQQKNTTAATEDVLLPHVAATLLATSHGASLPAISVLLSQLVAQRMPLWATESAQAISTLTQIFHRLASYHVPLVVYHLDRYLPGWCEPTLQHQGVVPSTWLLTMAAGEQQQTLPMEWVWSFWDHLFCDDDATVTRFMVLLSLLERDAERLMLKTGEELRRAARETFWQTMEDWQQRAEALKMATPESVLELVRQADDKVVQELVKQRQERTEAELKQSLAAQAEAYRQEQERKAEEARTRLTRARLVAFYRKHAPEKEGNIDTIMETYKGNYDVLDAKLYKKYGEGFNPAIKPKVPQRQVSKGTNNVLSTMNQGLGRQKLSGEKEEEETQKTQEEQVKQHVCVTVKASEVLPVLCYSREASSRQRRQHRGQKTLKFYLVDSRSDETARDQGRFPTAVDLSPEAMMDPERIKNNEEMFESLRGAVHIVIMGEGFSMIPDLYNQKMIPKLEELVQRDESRTNICALFFVKRGFPFVSVMEGGFAAAHSWLVRQGPSHHLNISEVLVDYDPEISLFGQLETLHNATATEKAQRTMQSLLDKSVVMMTKRAQQLDWLASDLERRESKQTGLRFNFRFGGTPKDESKVDQVNQMQLDENKVKTDEKQVSLFKKPFADSGETNSSKLVENGSETLDSNEEATQDVPAINSKVENEGEKILMESEVAAPVLSREVSDETKVSENDESPSTPAVAGDNLVETAQRAEATITQNYTTATSAETVPIPSQPTISHNVATPSESSDASLSSTASGSNTTINTNESKPIPNPFKGFGAVIQQHLNVTGDVPTETKQSNPFKGFGFQQESSAKQQAKRNNPFARFGGSQDARKGLASLNNLRKSTLARIRSSGSDDVVMTEGEDTIAFETSDES